MTKKEDLKFFDPQIKANFVQLLRIMSSGKLLGVKPKAGPTASKPHSSSAAVSRIATRPAEPLAGAGTFNVTLGEALPRAGN